MNTAFVAAICADPLRVECIAKFERLSEEHQHAVRMLVDALYRQTIAEKPSNIVQLHQQK